MRENIVPLVPAAFLKADDGRPDVLHHCDYRAFAPVPPVFQIVVVVHVTDIRRYHPDCLYIGRGRGVIYRRFRILQERNICHDRKVIRRIVEGAVCCRETALVDIDAQRSESMQAYMIRFPLRQAGLILQVLSAPILDFIRQRACSSVVLEKVIPP